MSAKQSWLSPKLRMRESRIHDKGVFVTEAIKRGERGDGGDLVSEGGAP